MAESSWWEQVLNRLFVGAAHLQFQHMEARNDIVGDLDPPPASPRPGPTAAPTAGPNAPPANPNQTETEQVTTGITGAISTAQTPNPLYGTVPTGKVYMGNDPKKWTTGSGRVSGPDGMNIAAGDKTSSIQDVVTDLNTWSEKKRKKFSDLAVSAGLMKDPSINYDDLEPILGALAIRSAKLLEKGVKITPWSLLDRYGSDAIDAAAKAGPITTTSTSRSVNLSSGRDANSLVDAALASRLGRSATDEEKKKFLAALNAAEKKEPTVTKTTTTTSGSGTEAVSSNSSSQTSGGVNATSFASEWSGSHNKDEAGSYQALSQYMPAFFQALGAPV